MYASTGSPCPFRLDLNSLSVEISSPIRQLGVEAAVAPAMPVEEEGEEPSSPMDVHETHELGKHEKQEVMEPSQPLQDETSSDIMSPILAVLHDVRLLLLFSRLSNDVVIGTDEGSQLACISCTAAKSWS